MDKEANQGIMLVNRMTGELQQETVFGDGALRFMYETLLGKTFWGIAFHSAKLSSWLGKLYDSPRSKKKIPAPGILWHKHRLPGMPTDTVPGSADTHTGGSLQAEAIR